MSAPRGLSSEHNDLLIPIIISCMEMTQKNLEGLIQNTIRFSATRGYLIELHENDLLNRPRHAYAVFNVSGEVEGRIAFLCPIPLATTLAGMMLMLDEEAIGARRKAAVLNSDEEDAFRETGNLLGAGLDAAFRESSSETLHIQFAENGLTEKWNAEETFSDGDLVHFVTECKVAALPSEEIHLVMTRKFVRDVTGMDVGEADAESSGFAILAPEGRALLTLAGAAVGMSEKKLIRAVGDAHSLEVEFTDDVRELVSLIINRDCAGAVVGDRLPGANTRAAEINGAALKRLRSHPKGRDLPIFYVVEWPERDHVSQMAQLGVRDIVGLPAKADLLEKRIKRFIELSLQKQFRSGT
jgi:chemotaxis protein CheY-P-specific phosphatase CheC